jgi:sulfatase maturation enzyme AslB (radical SAM superfamily)
MSSEKVIEIYADQAPDHMLIIGGEPMLMGIPYYMDILNAGVMFAMQTNFTLYTEEWNQVFLHRNFEGLSVSGDKMPELEFLKKLKLLRDTTGLDPLVLVIATDSETVHYWYYLAIKHNFALKFNYLMPIGKLKGKYLDVKQYYKLMIDFMDTWDTQYRIEPMYSLLNDAAVCPYINCVTETPDIYSYEPDGEKFFCCALSSLRISKDQLPDGRVVPMDCLTCDAFTECRGCVVRNNMVAGDAGYCNVMKTFFNKIKEKRNVR